MNVTLTPKPATYPCDVVPILSPDALLAVLMGYALTYASYYVAYGQRLCQSMLKRYAEIDTIQVPVPSYRGFHVRPATLIAKIVLHYGSDVRYGIGRRFL